MKKGKFTLGQLVATTNALESLNGEDIQIALGRHISGDWGDIDHPEDWEANCFALEHGEGRLFSVYHDRKGVKFWIITEADRSATTVLLPEDY